MLTQKLLLLEIVKSLLHSHLHTTPDHICKPNPPSLKAAQLSPPFSTCSTETKHSLLQRHPDQNKNTPDILTTYNYPFKTYNVTTKDGYILTVYRIIGSPNIKNKKNGIKQAVYLNHGLGLSSDCWMFQPASRNLPFMLADAGHEVWLGNARGTTYSLGHVKYNWQTDLQYWNFSWHEMGIYDVPAVTDKIIEESKNKKIIYIGYSMGTTQYFVSLSEIPEMNDKISAGFLLAPIGFIGHANSPIRLLSPFINTDFMFQILNIALMGRLNSAQQLRTQLNLSPGDLCDLTATKCGVCDNLIFMLMGYDAPQMNNTELPNIWAKFPNNVSVKTLAHFAQSMSKCTFKKYDFGPSRNEEVYKNSTAPDNDLAKIKVPTYFLYGKQDNLGPPNDVKITARKLTAGVLKQMVQVNSDLFMHLDFITAKDADKLVYNLILKEMRKTK